MKPPSPLRVSLSDVPGRVRGLARTLCLLALGGLVAGPVPAGADTQKSSTAPSARQAPAVQPRFVVVIDAGHGGKDGGAQGPRGTLEKDVVLAVARRLARQLNREPGMRGILVRADDRFLNLRQRAEIAHRARADLFVSLHADAYADGEASGSSVYILSESGASSEAARCLADRENAGEVGGVDLSAQDAVLASVLVDLSKNANIEASERAAGQVLGALQQEFRLHNPGVQKAGFAVLKSLDVPSLLVEMAFISNPDEEARLLDPKQQERLAGALYRGIRQHAATLGRLPPDPAGAATSAGRDNPEPTRTSSIP